jgi:hypothetical protein
LLVSSPQSIEKSEQKQRDQEISSIKLLVDRIPISQGTVDSVELPDIFDSASELDYDEHQRKFVMDVILRTQQTCPVEHSSIEG